MALTVAWSLALAASGGKSCVASDANLRKLRATICASLGGDCGGTDFSNYTAQGDWPSQAVYMNNLLEAMSNPDTCLDTAYAANTTAWLEMTNNVTSPWWNTWVVFQVQYFDMPHRHGARVETAATLGRKCWAFAYLTHVWTSIKPRLIAAVRKVRKSVAAFVAAYDAAVGTTLPLCNRVMANCFVNASYSPEVRNGTCPSAIGQFFVGYSWEDGGGGRPDMSPPVYGALRSSVPYPFPVYSQTPRFHADVAFAVNSTLNYII